MASVDRRRKNLRQEAEGRAPNDRLLTVQYILLRAFPVHAHEPTLYRFINRHLIQKHDTLDSCISDSPSSVPQSRSFTWFLITTNQSSSSSFPSSSQVTSHTTPMVRLCHTAPKYSKIIIRLTVINRVLISLVLEASLPDREGTIRTRRTQRYAPPRQHTSHTITPPQCSKQTRLSSS